jgi:hypothetical protein
MSAISFNIRINSEREIVVSGLNGRLGTVVIPESVEVGPGDVLSVRLTTASQDTPGTMSVQIGVRSPGNHMYAFGGDPTTAGNYFRANEVAQGIGLTSVLDRSNQHAVAIASTAQILAFQQPGAAVWTGQLLKNGIIEEALNFPGTTVGTLALSTVYAAGDLMAIEFDAGTDPTDVSINVEMTTVGHNYFYGGAPNAALDFFGVNETSETLATITAGSDPRVSQRIVAGGSLTVSWVSAGTGTGTFELVKNYSFGVTNSGDKETFGDLSTTSGVATLTTTVVAGDIVGIRAAAGATTPSATTMVLSVTPV